MKQILKVSQQTDETPSVRGLGWHQVFLGSIRRALPPLGGKAIAKQPH